MFEASADALAERMRQALNPFHGSADRDTALAAVIAALESDGMGEPVMVSAAAFDSDTLKAQVGNLIVWSEAPGAVMLATACGSGQPMEMTA